MVSRKKTPHRLHPKVPTPTNGTLSVGGYGSFDVRIRTIAFGMEIISSSANSRMFRTLYTRAVTDEAFAISVVCNSQAEYERLGTYLLNYGRKAAAGTLGLMRVRFPSRNFDRYGVPGGTTFGVAVTDVTWPMSIAFTGAADLVSTGTKDVTTLSNVLGGEYLSTIKKDPSAAYYYPVGSQLTGTGAGADMLYDAPPVDTTPGPPGGGSISGSGHDINVGYS